MGGWQWVVARRQTSTCLLLSLLALVAELNAELDFAVHVKEGGGEAAERIARKHGMKNMGEVNSKFALLPLIRVKILSTWYQDPKIILLQRFWSESWLSDSKSDRILFENI